jgi:adenosine deaminase
MRRSCCNEFTLGVKGNEHPYRIYQAYGVPIVLGTDDSGVLRCNLSLEYLLLATRYKPSYKTIKEYVYNSIQYAFLTDVAKTALLKALDARYTIFESEMAAYADGMDKKR